MVCDFTPFDPTGYCLELPCTPEWLYTCQDCGEVEKQRISERARRELCESLKRSIRHMACALSECYGTHKSDVFVVCSRLTAALFAIEDRPLLDADVTYEVDHARQCLELDAPYTCVLGGLFVCWDDTMYTGDADVRTRDNIELCRWLPKPPKTEGIGINENPKR